MVSDTPTKNKPTRHPTDNAKQTVQKMTPVATKSSSTTTKKWNLHQHQKLNQYKLQNL